MGLPTICLLRVGRVRYGLGLQVQKQVQQQLLQHSCTSAGTLIVLEHEPVYTLGLREKEDEQEIQRLKATGAEVVHSDRGGLSTFHGPGQLVAYPIFHLNRLCRTQLRTFVANLELVGVHTCRLLGVPAQMSGEHVSHTGAWANGNKICAVGVHCKRHVTTHGLALNCDVDLKWFDHIVPCGITDKGVTSLTQELGAKVTVHDAEGPLIDCFQSIFKCRIVKPRDNESKQWMETAMQNDQGIM